MNKEEPKKEKLNLIAQYSGLGIQMGVIITLGVFGGDYLDDFFAFKTPILTIVFSLLSVFIALYFVLKGVIHLNKDK